MKRVILSVLILLLLLIACSDNGDSKSGSGREYRHEEGTFSQNRFNGSWSAGDMIFDFGTDSLYFYKKKDDNFTVVILPYSVSSNGIGDALDGFNDTLKIGAPSDPVLIYAFTQDKINQMLIKLCMRDGVFVNERIKTLDVYSGVVRAAQTNSLKHVTELSEVISVSGNTFVTTSDDIYADGELRHSELDLTKGGEMVHFFPDGRCVTLSFSDIDSLETESYDYSEFLTYQQDGSKIILNNESCYYLENGVLVWKSQGETAFTNGGEFIYSYYTPYKGELPGWIK